MKPLKKSESASAKGADAAPGAHLPSGWLAVIVTLLVVPWLVVGWVYWQRPVPAGAGAVSNGAPVAAGAGAWGALSITPIVVSPPLEYVSPLEGRHTPPAWHFPQASAEMVEAFFASVGLPPADVLRLRNSSRLEPRINGLVVSPGPAWIRTLSPEVRARLYERLEKSPLNWDQEQAFRFLGTSAASWLHASQISAETRALVEPLIYRRDNFLYFADIEAVRPLIQDTAEFQRLLKTLLRHSTVLVHLSVSREADVDALADYWGRGGRRTDIRPLLESIAGAEDRSIDIVHLLPTFARTHLYRYPKLTTEDFDRPVLANCLWSALNFFRPTPDDRYLDPETALNALRKDYYVVEHGYQLGDVVAFLADENLFHVAVYLADGLAFTKNGTSPMAPWTIMELDDIKESYRWRTENPRLIYHRRGDF